MQHVVFTSFYVGVSEPSTISHMCQITCRTTTTTTPDVHAAPAAVAELNSNWCIRGSLRLCVWLYKLKDTRYSGGGDIVA